MEKMCVLVAVTMMIRDNAQSEEERWKSKTLDLFLSLVTLQHWTHDLPVQVPLAHTVLADGYAVSQSVRVAGSAGSSFAVKS